MVDVTLSLHKIITVINKIHLAEEKYLNEKEAYFIVYRILQVGYISFCYCYAQRGQKDQRNEFQPSNLYVMGSFLKATPLSPKVSSIQAACIGLSKKGFKINLLKSL